MRRISNTVLYTIAFLSLILVGCTKTTQQKKEPFIAELSMPNFRLATMQDSTMILSKDIPKEGIVMLKYFSPDCDHCQKEAQKFVAKKDSLKNIQTLWMSGDWASLQDIKTFAKTYGIEQLNPKYIGKDVGSNLVLYYDLKSVPFTAIYKDNQLIKQYKNDINFDELIAMNTGKFIPAPKDSILKTVRKSPFLKKN